MGIGKHTAEAQRIKELEETIRLKDETIELKDRTIKDIQTECADQFKLIRDLCFANEYDGLNDKNAKLRKIEEIASSNFSALVNDIVISDSKEKAKIIELPNTGESR